MRFILLGCAALSLAVICSGPASARRPQSTRTVQLIVMDTASLSTRSPARTSSSADFDAPETPHVPLAEEPIPAAFRTHDLSRRWVEFEMVNHFVSSAAPSRTAGADPAPSAQVGSAQGMTRDPALRERLVDWTTGSDRRAMASAMRDVLLTDARPGLAAMTTPVTALYAADADGGAPAAQADQAWTSQYAPLPGAKLVRIDGSRHFIMADQPERFAQALDAFLAD